VLGCGCPGDAPDHPNPTLGGVLNLPSDLSHGVAGGTSFESGGSLGRVELTQASFGTTQILTPHLVQS
jgi:hypothetical protein